MVVLLKEKVGKHGTSEETESQCSEADDRQHESPDLPNPSERSLD